MDPIAREPAGKSIFTIDEILSCKYKRGFFGGYAKTEDYDVVIGSSKYIIPNVVFDMHVIGKEPIKLLRSMLMYWNPVTNCNLYDVIYTVLYNSVRRLVNVGLEGDRKIYDVVESNRGAAISGALLALSLYPEHDACDCKEFHNFVYDLLKQFLGGKHSDKLIGLPEQNKKHNYGGNTGMFDYGTNERRGVFGDNSSLKPCDEGVFIAAKLKSADIMRSYILGGVLRYKEGVEKLMRGEYELKLLHEFMREYCNMRNSDINYALRFVMENRVGTVTELHDYMQSHPKLQQSPIINCENVITAFNGWYNDEKCSRCWLYQHFGKWRCTFGHRNMKVKYVVPGNTSAGVSLDSDVSNDVNDGASANGNVCIGARNMNVVSNNVYIGASVVPPAVKIVEPPPIIPMPNAAVAAISRFYGGRNIVPVPSAPVPSAPSLDVIEAGEIADNTNVTIRDDVADDMTNDMTNASVETVLSCGICMDVNKKCVFVPCGHTACTTCAAKLKECHLCRADIKFLQPLFQ